MTPRLRERARRSRAVAVAALVAALSPALRASEEVPRCAGRHDLASPVPESCLETIDTDRPHQTDTPHVVAAGHVQIESAIAAVALGGELGAAPGARGARLAVLENNYKVGVVDHVDVQLLFKHAEYLPERTRFAPPGPYNLRVKLNIVSEHGPVPAVTLVPTLFVPVERARSVRGGAIVFWGWELPGDFELEMNAGALFGKAPKAVAAVLAAAVTRPVLGKLKAFVDVYASGWDIALGTGLLIPITRDVQLDGGAYIGVHGDVAVVTPFAGVSVRR